MRRLAAVLACAALPVGLLGAPANDNFVKATTIASGGASVSGSNVGASKQSGEPNHAGNPGGKSVWWEWTASSNASVTISTSGSNFDTLLGVYTGPNLSNLVAAGANDDIGFETTSALSFTATSGTTYFIAVDGFADPGGGIADSGNISLTLTVGGSPPANDNFSSASPLPPGGGSAGGSNVNATRQGGEPIFAGDSGQRSVWWTWTPSQTGNARIDTLGSNFDTILGVFTGSAVDALTLAGDNDDAGDLTTSSVVIAVTSGTTYRIAVDGWGGDTGSINVSAQFINSVPPPNDNFADAITLPGSGGSTSGSTVDATKQTGEPNHAGDEGGHSVWWNWTAPGNGTVAFSTAGSNFDTLLGVYTGTAVNALSEIASNDDDVGSLTSRVEFLATAGTTYRVAVDGWAGDVGSVSLSTQFTASAPPANDAFANSIAIPGSGGSDTGTNVGATKESGEPNHAGNSGGHSVWWTWTAPGAGTATISTEGSGFDTLLGVYTGGAVNSLSEAAANNDDGGLQTSRVQFGATSGTIYRIAVDGTSGAVGSVSISVQFTPASAPANDAFANAIALPAGGGSTTGTNVDASKEPGELAHAGNVGGHSVWWAWTPSQNGTAVISTASSGFNTLLGVYTGTAVNALSEVAANDDDGGLLTSRVEFAATAGTTYRIAVDGSGGAVGSVNLSVSFTANQPPANDDFANAIQLPSEGGNTLGSNSDATKQTGEPNHADNSGGRSVWWKWTAPGNLNVAINTTGSEFDTLLGVYTGASVGTLTTIVSNDDDGANATSRVEFPATSGATYFIAVDGFNDGSGAESGQIVLTLVGVVPIPDAPVAGAATSITTSGFTANWTASSGATGYRLDVSTNNTFATYVSGYQNLDVGSATSHAVTGLSSSTTYYYRIRAYNGSGTSANSGTISATTATPPPPDAPVASGATLVTTSGFTANWSASTGATGYRLDVSTNNSFSSFVSGYQNLDVGNSTNHAVTGLSSSTTYYYRVRATNSSGTSGNSGTISATTANPPAPAAPVASAATSVSTSGFVANWNASSGATGYRLDVSTSNAFGSFVSGYENLDVGNNTSRSVTGLSPGTTYYYRVRATNVSGTSPNSGTISVATLSAPPPAPDAPVAKSATSITSTGFVANWNASAGATGYRLDVSTSNTFASYVTGYQDLDVGNATSRSVSGLTSNTTYYYRIRATNESGPSSNSSTITVTTSVPAPSAPVASAATSITTSGFTANWSASAGATGYRLDVSTSNTFVSYVSGYQDLDVGNATNRAVTGLSADTSYHYRIRAYNGSGASASSSTISVTTAGNPPNAPVAGAATSITTSGFTANWSASAGATGYRLDVSTSNTFVSYVSGYQDLDVGNATNRGVSGLSAGTNYYYRVRAYNGSGTSSNSSTISATTTSDPPNAPVASAATSITTTGFTANWSASTGATGYRLDVSTSNTFVSYVSGYQDLDVGNASSRAVSNLSASTTYYYRIRAYNGSGTSANSGTIAATTANPPAPAPPVVGAASSITNTGFVANWGASSGATGYRLDVSTNNSFSSYLDGYQNLDIGNATNLAVSGLTAGTTYYYRVRAYNSTGTSANSATITVATTAASFAGLVNLSTRAFAGSGGDTLIIGFYITGSASKTLIIRGVGPELQKDPYNVPNVVADPSIVVYGDSVQIASNDNWDSSLAADFATVGAFALTPGSKDAALKITLQPGIAYTVHLVNPGAVAEALLEVYDLSKNADSRLVNISCRLRINAGQTVIVGAFLQSKTTPVLIRGVGPTLGTPPYNVPGVLPDPFLRLYSGSTETGSNDDWDAALEPYFVSSGAFGLAVGSKDAAMRPTLSPGGFTVHATGNDGGSGVVLVELYDGS